MSNPGDAQPGGVAALVATYPQALPQVYGYLVLWCRSVVIAEELTSETFLAALTAVESSAAPDPTVAWLIGIARHKLVDHWRRAGREERNLRVAARASESEEDPWDEAIDTAAAHEALARLSPLHRVALTLRYLDGLPVAEVADHLGRSLQATETLLVRARAALRRVYREEAGGDA